MQVGRIQVRVAEPLVTSMPHVNNTRTPGLLGFRLSLSPSGNDVNTDHSSYVLIEGQGDTDNALFTIEDDQLKTATVLNYEAKDEYTIRVKGTDSGGLSVEKTFTINLTDAPDSPTDILLSGSTVDENLKKGTVVGNYLL